MNCKTQAAPGEAAGSHLKGHRAVDAVGAAEATARFSPTPRRLRAWDQRHDEACPSRDGRALSRP
jgi:hypothetical protein